MKDTDKILAQAKKWWKDNMKSKLHSVCLKKDGYLRFEWFDEDESGSYHLKLSSMESGYVP